MKICSINWSVCLRRMSIQYNMLANYFYVGKMAALVLDDITPKSANFVVYCPFMDS